MKLLRFHTTTDEGRDFPIVVSPSSVPILSGDLSVRAGEGGKAGSRTAPNMHRGGA